MWRAICDKLWQFVPLTWRPRKILAAKARANRWRYVRAAHLKTEPKCAACGRETNLDVHHIIPVHINPNRELDPTNLITLCSDRCHIVFGHFMCYLCYNPDVRKMAAEYRVKLQKRTCLDRLHG